MTETVAVFPATTLTLFGCVVIVGFVTAAVTVSVAGLLVTLPAALEAMQRYFRPLKPALAVKVMVSVLQPALVLSCQVTPPSVLYCHWYWSPSPLASRVSVTLFPAWTLTSFGCVVIDGFVITVRMAGSLVTLPAALETIQRYLRPLKPALTLKVMEDVL